MKYNRLNFINKRLLKILFYWVLFWAIQSVLMSGGKHVEFYLLKNIAIVSLQAIVVYLNVYLLLPFLFQKKRYILYALSSILLVYLIFSVSFFFIERILSTSYKTRSNLIGVHFSTDFWRILSGSSFYSLALVCSTIYHLLMLNKRVENENEKMKKVLTSETLCIKEGNKSHYVNTSDILYIEGLREYVIWNTEKKKIISLESLKGIEEKLGEKGFKRVHKSYIVNTRKISFLSSSSLEIGEAKIPIGRKYKHTIKL